VPSEDKRLSLADPLSKEFYEMCKGFIASKLVLHQNRPEDIIHGDWRRQRMMMMMMMMMMMTMMTTTTTTMKMVIVVLVILGLYF